MSRNGYSVGEVVGLAHVSVRTLHHYDAVGLLRPSARSGAGHRRYAESDLGRLREILFYRELGFGLDKIAAILAEPGAGAADHLRTQHRLLRERIKRDQQLLQAIEKEMEARTMGMSLTPQEQLEVFQTNRISEWSAEAEQRWGDTAAVSGIAAAHRDVHQRRLGGAQGGVRYRPAGVPCCSAGR